MMSSFVNVNGIISDHTIVDIKLAICKPGLPKKNVSHTHSGSIVHLDNLVEQDNVCLTYLMDKHSPV